ncbi:hypothetical protein EV424DRAFT_161421 [Suillus variegatus]|nr:hypothetical protein EV424DRAFT_161421 [Suillus variegatus]
MRANIDIQKLNTYLKLHVPVIATTKQFKVRSQSIENGTFLPSLYCINMLSLITQSWLSAICSLAALDSLDPFQLGLENFGPTTDYFPRQIKSFTRISVAQSQAIDIEIGKATGNISYFEEMVGWYQRHLPDEGKTGLRIVHGDYKLDNMIFHPG